MMQRRREAMSLLPLAGLSAYFIASIFDIFPVGTPQPADYFLAGVIGLTVLFSWRRPPADDRLYIASGLLIAWILLVNVVWFLLTPDFVFARKTIFYIFNILVFLFVIVCGYHDFPRLRTVIRWSCIAGLVLQLAYLHLVEPADGAGAGARVIGTFNNPNQLGYWALLTMACLAVAKERPRLDVWDVLALAIGIYLTVISASRAASVAAIVLLACIIFTRGFDRKSGILAALLLAFGLIVEVAGGGLIANITETQPVTRLMVRFERQKEDEVLNRGYQRILEHPQYAIFGAGEGRFERFDLEHGGETHSSLGTLVLSYGIVGLSLFAFLMFSVLRRAPVASIAYMVPVMLYGTVHMGLRFTHFWLFLALVYAHARHRPRSRAHLHDSPGPDFRHHCARSSHHRRRMSGPARP